VWKKNQIFPDMTIKCIWEKYAKNALNNSDAFHLLIYNNLHNFSPDTRKKILSDLVKVETDSDRQNDRLRYIRIKLMDLVDRRITAKNLRQSADHDGRETVRYDNSSGKRLEHAMEEYDLQITMLRAYTRDKYGDVCKDDWYDMYTHLAEFFNDQISKDQNGGSAGRFLFQEESMEPTGENFQLCRTRCLDAYVGQQFDIPADRTNRLLKLLRKIRRKSIWRKLVS
jgi:hypothetical protein